MSDQPDDKPPYKVGYGKPPQNWQFKPGTTGNRAGRPKRKPPDPAGLLDEPLAVRENGEVRYMHPKELALQQQFKKALEEDDTATQLHLIEKMERHGLLASQMAREHGGVVVLDDRTMPFAMARILAAAAGTGPWSAAQIAKARAQYCAGRSAKQAQIDAAIGYAALQDGENDHE